MRLIGSLVGHPADQRSVLSSKRLVSDSLIGVEIELEGLHDLPHITRAQQEYTKYWNIVKDGSLRGEGNAEFVLAEPLGGKDLVRSLLNFERTVRTKKWEPDLSDRTSVHIHVDVRDLTKDEVRNFVLLFIIFERVLFKYAGPDRNDNIFCQGFEYSQGILPDITQQFKVPDEVFNRHLVNFEKYAACNLKSITTHGSLEFRLHVGEFRASRLLEWINILLSMKKYASGVRFIPTNLPSEISSLGINKFFKQVFGRFSRSLDYPELETDILEGIRLSQDVIHYDSIIEEPSPSAQLKKKKSPFQCYLEKNKKVSVEKRITIDELVPDWQKIIFEEIE